MTLNYQLLEEYSAITLILMCPIIPNTYIGGLKVTLCFTLFSPLFSSCYHIDHGLVLSLLLCHLRLHKQMESMLTLLMTLPKSWSPALTFQVKPRPSFPST